MADIVRAGALWGFDALVRSLGGDLDSLLREAGLPEHALCDPDRFIPRTAIVALLNGAAERLACPAFGLRLAELQNVYILGPLAFAIRHAPSLRGAVEAASRYFNVHAPEEALVLQPLEGGLERLVFHAGHEAPQDRAQSAEHAVGLICRILLHLTDGLAHPQGAQFRHARISPLATYREVLGVTPEFEADADAVILRSQDLSRPLSSADGRLHAMIERFLESQAPEPGQSVERRARQTLASLMRMGGPASMEDVADALRLHPRTLQRRLADEGATFEKLRDDVRKELAEALLAHDVVPLAHVAHLLGYADQSVLTRSSIRWFGKTPMAVRKEKSRAAG